MSVVKDRRTKRGALTWVSVLIPPPQFHSRSFTLRGPKRAFGSEKVVWTGWMLGPVAVEEPNQDMMELHAREISQGSACTLARAAGLA